MRRKVLDEKRHQSRHQEHLGHCCEGRVAQKQVESVGMPEEHVAFALWTLVAALPYLWWDRNHFAILPISLLIAGAMAYFDKPRTG